MTEDIQNFEEKIKKLEEQLKTSQDNGSRYADSWTNELCKNRELKAKVEILKEILREMFLEGKK